MLEGRHFAPPALNAGGLEAVSVMSSLSKRDGLKWHSTERASDKREMSGE